MHYTYTFWSVDDFIYSFEKELIDMLYDYQLLDKFTPNVKKIIVYIFINKLNWILHEKNVLLYHTGCLDEKHELFHYFDYNKLNKFINKICKNIKKVTYKLFFIKNKIDIDSANIHELDGEIQDEIILLNNNKVEYEKLKEFLSNYNLKDLFDSFSKTIH